MKMMTPTFFELYTVYIKNKDNFFPYFTRYMHRSVVSHKYLKLISMKTLVLGFLRILCIRVILLIKL